MKKIAIIGAGNLGIAIAEGLIKKNVFKAEQIIATRKNLTKLKHLEELGVTTTDNNHLAVIKADYILICVKPFMVENILNKIKDYITSSKTLISVATGVPLETYEQIVGKNVNIFRAITNTAASIEESVTCVCTNTEDDNIKNQAKTIFDSIGTTIFIEEELMNAATVIGASGIAFVLRFIHAMVQGGVQIGLEPETATKIVTQTVKGASELLIQKNMHPEQEIDKVTTPNGCTIAGLNEMEHNGFSSALIKGIKTSFDKI